MYQDNTRPNEPVNLISHFVLVELKVSGPGKHSGPGIGGRQ